MINKPTYGFFHVALMQGLGGLMIASEMHGRLQESGLYAASDKIIVSIVGDQEQARVIFEYIFARYPKYDVQFVSGDIRHYEWPALIRLRDQCLKENCDVWYAHTKGASNCRPDVPGHIQRNIRNWRGVMCYDLMTRHKESKELLKEYGAVGSFLSTDKPSGPHFVGNFWWATSDHINSLPPLTDELTANRMYAESWVGTNHAAKMHGMSVLPDYDCYDFHSRHQPNGVFYGMPGAI
jgi:hypothetical protein